MNNAHLPLTQALINLKEQQELNEIQVLIFHNFFSSIFSIFSSFDGFFMFKRNATIKQWKSETIKKNGITVEVNLQQANVMSFPFFLYSLNHLFVHSSNLTICKYNTLIEPHIGFSLCFGLSFCWIFNLLNCKVREKNIREAHLSFTSLSCLHIICDLAFFTHTSY